MATFDARLHIVALVAVVALYRVCSLTRAMIFSWLSVVVLFAVGDLEINRLLYGGFFKTGYASGLVTFGTSAIIPNIERMPSRLIESIPMSLLALGSLAWIVVRLVQSRMQDTRAMARAKKDATVALVLLLGWLSVWGLYAMYIWTVGQTEGPGNPVHVVRFYLPALGLIALLAAWILKQLPRWFAPALLVLVGVLGVWSFESPSNHVTFTGIPLPPPVHKTGVVSQSQPAPTSKN